MTSLSAPGGRSGRDCFRWRPFISFEDTNLMGNVYFARFVSWQGKCREAFLVQHAAGLLPLLARDLRLVTTSVSCEFREELHAFDALELEMRLVGPPAWEINLSFDYRLDPDASCRCAAIGRQTVRVMRQSPAGDLSPAELPDLLAEALQLYAGGDS
jgi:enediyne biosynthesis thioesterase